MARPAASKAIAGGSDTAGTGCTITAWRRPGTHARAGSRCVSSKAFASVTLHPAAASRGEARAATANRQAGRKANKRERRMMDSGK
jgi:hypothetical protein